MRFKILGRYIKSRPAPMIKNRLLLLALVCPPAVLARLLCKSAF